jgi:hypothetical protein
LYSPASDKEIDDFENALEINLPGDFKAFYKFCNGFESEEDLFRIIPLQEILSCCEEYTTGTFYIAEYMVYCDIWMVAIEEGGKYKISHDFILTDSFTAFLHHFLIGGVFEKGGLYDWGKSTHNKTL